MKDNYLLKMINKQINFNKGRNIFYDYSGILLKPSVDFKSFILNNIDNILFNIQNIEYLEYISGKAVNLVIRKLYEINQFINLTKEDKGKLKKIYHETAIDICNLYVSHNKNFSNLIDKIFNDHYIKLRNFIIETNGENLFKSYKFFKHTPLIINSDYSSAFQMELLNLNINLLEEPVLDIGCGLNGNLINFLRRNNISAYGIDRIIKKIKYTKKADWLEFPYKKRKWGTIISHMSFSNHFMHHFVKNSSIISKYIETYSEIINSLKINGAFIYTPCLPFIEKELLNNSICQVIKNDVLYKNKILNSVVRIVKIK